MESRQTQQLKTVQKLALTTEMRGSLALLQMGQEELDEKIRRETRCNPFLSVVPPVPRGSSTDETGRGLDALATPEDSLAEIRSQIALIRLVPEERRLAEALTYCLDSRGFIADPADEICAYLEIKPSMLATVVAKIQTEVEPAGLFAWSLRDCFRIQLEAANRADRLILHLLTRLDLVATRDLPGICRICGVEEEDARDMLDDIRSLDPAPLARRGPQPTVAHVPELIFRRDAKGQGVAELNAAALPRILTDDGLFDTLRIVDTDDRALAYYGDCYRRACAIVLAMQKRANMLLRIGHAMALRQSKFVRTGRMQDRKPLTMGNLAQDLGVNKSTISRALNQCFVDTERGILAASAFFVQPLSQSETERTREQALRRLAVMVKTENRRAPFTDRALADQLFQVNLPVSRRVVAKYRALLGIPSYRDRRTI